MGNPQIADNPDWKPFIKAVLEADVAIDTGKTLLHFMKGYPKYLRDDVALALSLAKWHLVTNEVPINKGYWPNCGCCAVYYEGGACDKCPLGPGDTECLYTIKSSLESDVRRTDTETYNRIISIYTKHFNKLPAKDRQKVEK